MEFIDYPYDVIYCNNQIIDYIDCAENTDVIIGIIRTYSPNYIGCIYKNNLNKNYIDDGWFGRIELPDDITNYTIIKTKNGKFGQIKFYDNK
jgi:uncharacterized Fe-S radical SAM superfamily protein PflX